MLHLKCEEYPVSFDIMLIDFLCGCLDAITLTLFWISCTLVDISIRVTFCLIIAELGRKGLSRLSCAQAQSKQLRDDKDLECAETF